MSHDDLTLYLVGELSPEDHDAFERHLAGCAECQAELVEMSPALDALAVDVAETPPAGLRDAVLSGVAHTPQVRPLRPARRGWLLSAAAVLALVVIFGGVLTSRDPVDAILASPDAVTIAVSPTDAYDGAAAIEAVYDSDGGLALIGSDLATADAELTYQAWVIGADGPAPAGLFQPDADGAVRVALDIRYETGDLIGVTVEPSGGSPAPTGEILFLSDTES